MLETPVLIVGGGISGLTLAYDLNARGIGCRVVEKATRLGGLIHTERYHGFLLDGGPDAFLTQKPHAVALVDELGLSSEVVPTNPLERKVYVLFRGRLRAMPEGMRLTVPTSFAALARSDLFSLSGKLRMLAERLVPRRNDIGEESIAEFVARRFGREALARVGEPLLAGIHCGDARRLSMSELFPRLVELERRFGSVSRGMSAAGSKGEATPFASLEGGMGRLVEALAEKLPESAVMTGERAVRLERREGVFVCSLASGRTIESSTLVVAVPIHRARALVEPLAPGVARELARIPTVSSAVVFHAFERRLVEHPLDGYGFVVPASESNRLLAATFVSTKFPRRAPEDFVLLRTFLGGSRDPEAVALDDDALTQLSLRELGSALGPLGKPLFSRIFRWKDRTPQVELGHAALLKDLDEALGAVPSLYLLGNGLSSVGIPDCIAAARRTAQEIARDLVGS